MPAASAACASASRRRSGSAPQSYYDVWWRGTWEKEAGGVTMGHGIHSIDTLAWLMGEPASLIADAATVKLAIEVEDTSAATVRFRNGAIGQIIVTVNAQDNRSRLEIFGDDLQAVSPRAPTARRRRRSGFDVHRPGRQPSARGRRDAPASRTRRSTCTSRWSTTSSRAIIDKRPPLVTVDECRRSMELITGIYKSAMTGARVDFPIAKDDPLYSHIPAEGADLAPVPLTASLLRT